MRLHSLKVAELLRSAACLHTNQSRSYLNHLVHGQGGNTHPTLNKKKEGLLDWTHLPYEHVTEGKTEGMRRQGRRCQQLVDEIMETIKYRTWNRKQWITVSGDFALEQPMGRS